jgi:hypothetical protein
MVNTFLVDPSFQQSAQILDRQRLGKQRVEAMQILHLVEWLHRLESKFRMTSSMYPNLQLYIRELVRRYRTCGVTFSIAGRLLISYPAGIPQHLMRGRPIKLGFVYHPAVRMWFGYPTALKMYINAHIDEWVRRGYQNNMERYVIPSSVIAPPWTVDPHLHANHRSALLSKERMRSEPIWYQAMDIFADVPGFGDYIWPVA